MLIRYLPMRRVGIIFGIVVLAGVLLVPFAPVRTTTVEVDAVSGQVRKSNLWTGGHRSTSVESTELADRLRALGVAWTPDWRTINVNDYNILGNATSRGCSISPPIYQLRPVLAAFASASSAEELREFVKVMQNGSESEQRNAVDQAGDRGLNALAVVRPGR
jgi:hypothetical protein